MPIVTAQEIEKMSDGSSENVVITDINEALVSSETDRKNEISEQNIIETIETVNTVVDGIPTSVPVSSLPVNSIINVSSSGTFNVISAEQLQVRISSHLPPQSFVFARRPIQLIKLTTFITN